MPKTEELITRVEELCNYDKYPLMKNGPIFEWRPGNIILDEQEHKEDSDNLMNNLQHQHNDNNGIEYVPDNYYGDDNSLGSREA